MVCRHNPSWLSAYLDGELSPAKTVYVRKLIAKCPSCRSEYNELRKVKNVVRQVRIPRMPRALAARIRQRTVLKKRGNR